LYTALVVVVVFGLLAGLTALPDDLLVERVKIAATFLNYAPFWLRDNIPSGLAEYVHYR